MYQFWILPTDTLNYDFRTGIHDKCMRLCGNFTENHTVELTEMVKIIVITSPTPPNFFRSFASVLLTAESAILNQGQFLLLVSEILSSEHSLQNTVYHTVQKNKQSHLRFYQTGDKLSSNWLIRSNFAWSKSLVCWLVRHVRRRNTTCLVAAPCTILKWRTVVKKERFRVTTEFAVNQWRK